MKKVIFCILFLGILWESFGQLVRRKDYDAAFALQVGGETSVLTAFQNAGFLLRPVAGLKMTFPFTRKWFLGGEINYSELKYSFAGPQQTDFHIKKLHVPVYLKYMLNCNKASVLFGLYGSYVADGHCFTGFTDSPGYTDISGDLETWSAGVTAGFEYRMVKRLHVMCRISGGVKEVMKKQPFFKDKLFPLQACITLSYDILRIGDCGCD